MDWDLTPLEIEHGRALYKQIVATHNACEDGLTEKDGHIAECECRKAYHLAIALVAARIPQRYWFLRLNSLRRPGNDKPVGLDSLIASRAYALVDTARTEALAAFGRERVIAGCSVFYAQADEFVDLFVGRAEDEALELLRHRLHFADVVLVDDLHTLIRSDYRLETALNAVKRLRDKGKVMLISYQPGPRVAPIESVLDDLIEPGHALELSDDADFRGSRVFLKDAQKYAGVIDAKEERPRAE